MNKTQALLFCFLCFVLKEQIFALKNIDLLESLKRNIKISAGKSDPSSASAIFLPLNISSSLIIDQQKNRVRLTCTNWPSHMEAMIPEGLSHNSVESIAKLIVSLGFNCVRYTYSIDFAANPNVRARTVYQNLELANLTIHADGISKYNPSLINASLIDVMQSVLKALANENVMVILDNHVSKAMWCCSMDDGNGWFGLGNFNIEDWLEGLKYIASFVNTNNLRNVVAMSLRNEVRAPFYVLDPEKYWFENMAAAAKAVHSANPFVLVIAGGLNYATDLSFITEENNLQKLVQNSDLANTKLLYEAHWYSWSDYGSNCTAVQDAIQRRWGFIFQNTSASFYTALIVSEIGDNMDEFTLPGNDYYDCVKSLLLEKNLSYATWVLSGSYYQRDGTADFHESFGLVDDAFHTIKSYDFLNFIASTQEPIIPLLITF